MCEYSHAMGNSNGNFQEYFDIILSSKHMQGGFIWDWVDQGISTQTSDGKKFFAYGGDLGGYALQNDENFCANGLVAADRTIHPGLHEVKKGYQNILFTSADISKGNLTVINNYDFTQLDNYNFAWRLYRNGEKIKEEKFSVSAAPHTSKEITLNIPNYKSEEGTEFFVEVFANTKNATELVPAGHEVAREQFKMAGDYFARSRVSNGTLTIQKDENRLNFSSGNISGVFDLRHGKLAHYSNGNKQEFINQYPEPYFWRAPTDNDFGNEMPAVLGVWRAAHVNPVVKSVQVGDQTNEGINITANFELAGVGVPYTLEYFISNTGTIKVTASIDMTGKDMPELPRFGMRLRMPAAFTNLTYYGRGPWENYTDRKFSSFVELYKDDVKNMYAWNYIRPQESGNRTDVRWFELRNAAGNGIRIEGIQPLGFSALNNPAEDLDPGLTKKQQHPSDIKPRNDVYVTIDLKQRGLGGDNSWGALPHYEYRLLDKKYSYSYIISLL